MVFPRIKSTAPVNNDLLLNLLLRTILIRHSPFYNAGLILEIRACLDVAILIQNPLSLALCAFLDALGNNIPIALI